MDFNRTLLKLPLKTSVFLLFLFLSLIFRYGGHTEFIRFKEYYVIPRGHSLSIYAHFLGKKRTSMYISREKSYHYYIQTRHNDLFSHYNLFLGKLKEKLARRARVYILSEYIGLCRCSLGIP